MLLGDVRAERLEVGAARAAPPFGGARLEQCPRLEDLAGLAQARAGDEGAAVALQRDQFAVGEALQRLADHGAADAEDVAHLVLGQPHPGGQAVLEDGPGQAVGQIFASRRRGKGSGVGSAVVVMSRGILRLDSAIYAIIAKSGCTAGHTIPAKTSTVGRGSARLSAC